MAEENVKKHRVLRITEGSIAEELGVQPGEYLLAVNGEEIRDIFDYRFALETDYAEVLMEDTEGEPYLLEIEKDEDEDLGLVFDSGLMDEYSRCVNRCIFCFIDQMPPGMRRTLYFKDDDARLSFLQGNYVTLTNLTDEDVGRICRFRMSPVNVSVHTTDPELRCRMLRNKNAGSALGKMKILKDAGIVMNGQIVLCKGINDGAALEKTLLDLSEYMPEMQSVSVVPVGLTKYRDRLYPLESFTGEDAEQVIGQVGRLQQTFLQKYGTRFVFLSDEWYLLAGQEPPAEEAYEGYPQLENGVGMVRSFLEETKDCLKDMTRSEGQFRPRLVTTVCGMLIYPYIERAASLVSSAFEGVRVRVLPVVNRFFGEKITVTGLLTGQDVIRALLEVKDKEGADALGEEICIPCEMLRAGETVFLDDRTTGDISDTLGIPVRVLPPGGDGFVKTVLGIEESTKNRRQQYEQADRSDRGTS